MARLGAPDFQENSARPRWVAGKQFSKAASYWRGSRFLKGMHPDFHGLDSRSLMLYTLFPFSQLLENMPIWKGLIHSTLLQPPPVPINPVTVSVHNMAPTLGLLRS